MVRLEKISYDNVWKILKLSVAEGQENYVATNTESIVEAYLAVTNNDVALPFAIFDDDTPIGFLMIGYGDGGDWETAPKIAKDNYAIWRFMIDKNYQHRGYGRQALQLAIDYVKTFPCGKAEYVYLSYEPENENARELYRSFGFEENGEKDGEEIVAVKKL